MHVPGKVSASLEMNQHLSLFASLTRPDHTRESWKGGRGDQSTHVPCRELAQESLRGRATLEARTERNGLPISGTPHLHLTFLKKGAAATSSTVSPEVEAGGGDPFDGVNALPLRWLSWSPRS